MPGKRISGSKKDTISLLALSSRDLRDRQKGKKKFQSPGASSPQEKGEKSLRERASLAVHSLRVYLPAERAGRRNEAGIEKTRDARGHAKCAAASDSSRSSADGNEEYGRGKKPKNKKKNPRESTAPGISPDLRECLKRKGEIGRLLGTFAREKEKRSHSTKRKRTPPCPRFFYARESPAEKVQREKTDARGKIRTAREKLLLGKKRKSQRRGPSSSFPATSNKKREAQQR